MYRIAEFFRGRYGADKLFYGMCIFAAVLAFINAFAGSLILQLVVYAIIVLAAVRAMSRNIVKRAAENRKFCGICDKIAGKFRLLKRMWKDRKTHCYVKCDGCKKILRLPKQRGVHTVKCPNCQNSFQVRI